MPRYTKKTIVRQDVILRSLCDQIVAGRARPGERLPPLAHVVEKFDSSPLTVNRVFRRLVDLGFARIEPGVGTFVTDHPPHLCRYALAFPDDPGDGDHLRWSRFFAALEMAAERLNQSGGPKRVAVYFDCAGHTDSEGYQHLQRDLATRSLAGVMFGFTPHGLIGSPLLDESDGAPRVAVESPSSIRLTSVGHDVPLFFARALDLLHAQGRRRVAFVMPPRMRGMLSKLGEWVSKRGMTTLPFWTQAVASEEPDWARHAIHAILHSGHRLVPDALIVTDDHLVEACADALGEFGVRVPDDLAVIGHWNFPLPYTRDVPVQRLGWDAEEMLARWIESIDARRRGESVPLRSTLTVRSAQEQTAKRGRTTTQAISFHIGGVR
jgi:DNA-binding LacI/PurR family transcriptional regulator